MDTYGGLFESVDDSLADALDRVWSDAPASRSRRDRGIVLLRNETRNQNDDIVQLFTARVIAPTRQSA